MRGGEDVTARDALSQLLAENPGGLVTCDMVYGRLDRVVSRNTVSKAAGSLGRSICVGRLGAAGGYVSRVKPAVTCPACGHTAYFGPVAIIDPEGEYQYVTCRRCGENYVVTEVGGTP